MLGVAKAMTAFLSGEMRDTVELVGHRVQTRTDFSIRPVLGFLRR
jgi:hypothetical protein